METPRQRWGDADLIEVSDYIIAQFFISILHSILILQFLFYSNKLLP